MIGALGWIPDTPDARDYAYSAVAPSPVALPARCSPLRSVPIRNQLTLGSCTGAAVSRVLRLQLAEAADVPLSALFPYYLGREALGTIGYDSGAMIRDVVAGVVKYGAPSEFAWPYIIERFAQRPPIDAYTEAFRHRGTVYARVNSVEDGKAALVNGHPFVLGFTVYSNFGNAGSTGFYPKPTGSRTGGHAVCAELYDDSIEVPGFGRGAFLIGNSWGVSWGIAHPDYPTHGAGFFWMPYDIVADRNYSDDLWTVTVAPLAT